MVAEVALDLIAVHRFGLAGHAHNLAQLVQRDLGSSEEERNSLLQLAQTWHEAATNLEASMGWRVMTVSARDTQQGQEP
jgi:hypothetical protein